MGTGMNSRRTLVLLSGGMDSVFVLHDALKRGGDVQALFFDYGQPAKDHELTAARIISKRRGVRLRVLNVNDAVCGVFPDAPKAGANKGINTANMPARNLVFIGVAAALAGCIWGDPEAWTSGKGAKAEIHLGPTFNDQKTFPDCRGIFEKAASEAAKLALYGILNIRVRFPLWKIPKADLMKRAAGNAELLRDIEESRSCYGSGEPCGLCSACVIRARAIERATNENLD